MKHTIVLFVTAAGCSQFAPPETRRDSVTDSPSLDCAQRALIEDGEDGDDRILGRAGRGGYLYTYVDEGGSSVSPSGDVTPSPGGAEGSERALRISGSIAEGDGRYAGIGFGFTDPKSTYDASIYTGLAFRARSGGGELPVRLKVPDRNTDPDGKICNDCYNDFGVDFRVGSEWTRYEIAFGDATQEAGWGTPRPESLEASALYGVQWQVAAAGPYELWIDDVTFTGCD